VTRSRVPPVVVLTDRARSDAAGRPLRATVAAALAGGAGAVLLREKDLPRDERRRLAEDLRALTSRAGAALWVASDRTLAAEVGAGGVHLAVADPWAGEAGSAAGSGLATGRSCHTPADLRDAAARGAAWATYSPVFPTESKPGYGPALGRDGLAAGCRAVPDLPVLALGGIRPDRARACLEAGAAGVALMGAVMGAADPEAVVRAVAAELVPLRSGP
jgi:thiamine-phosphate pyrophosphorylase